MEEQNVDKKHTSGWKLFFEIFMLIAGSVVGMHILFKLINKIF